MSGMLSFGDSGAMPLTMPLAMLLLSVAEVTSWTEDIVVEIVEVIIMIIESSPTPKIPFYPR